MKDEECVLYMSKGILQIGTKSVRVSLHKQNDSKCARIQIGESISIPPHHEMIISGKVNYRHEILLSP